MVLNPAKFGLFVELKDLFVEGLVPIETLMDDRYTYRENTREIVGTHGGRIYRAGDQVRVILDRVLALERKLQFAIVEESILATPARKAKEPIWIHQQTRAQTKSKPQNPASPRRRASRINASSRKRAVAKNNAATHVVKRLGALNEVCLSARPPLCLAYPPSPNRMPRRSGPDQSGVR